ncbi:hypothetical protein GT347_16120 [Xylophilus rhododendri]|uniref:Tip attachment protein J domain-containing protein n=1 Tax=Xylophilus rhododendri TaxID=2697032 RepID=A0A857J5X1_9BURK|nr:phage tail protein [Xylophilus rhododendri]QHI99370.1 hypothetical protein GT347_16120 [Xylophilus rhododendri]
MDLSFKPISLAIAAHPMRRDLDVRPVAPGRSLAQTLAEEGITGDGWEVSIGGALVPVAMWPHVRVKAGQVVEAQSLMRRQVAQLAAIVALSYFTFGAGGLAAAGSTGGAGLFGVGGAIGGGFWAAAATYVAGTLLINTLLSPKSTSAASASAAGPASYAISGVQNSPRPFGRLCLMLGECRVVPDLQSRQYGEFRGEDQYLSAMFAGGINCGLVTDLRIAGTSIAAYEGVTVTTAGFPGMAEQAMPVFDVDTIAGGLLDAPSAVPGPTVLRTSSPDTVVLAVDIEAQLFATDPGSGNYTALDLDIVIQYAPAGSGAWQPFVGTNPAVRLRNGTSRPLRVTYVLNVPAGQYDVRMWKATVNTDSDGVSAGASNTVSWTSLKSYQVDTADYGGQPRLRVEIKASGQLSGSLDSLTWIGRSAPMPLWNGTGWVMVGEPGSAGVSNPGALALLLLRGIYRPSDGKRIAGMGFSDSRIDLESFQEFMVRCIAMDFRFDAVIQEDMAIGDLIDTILDAGWGRLSRGGNGRYRVTWLAEDQPIEGVLNMAAIKARSFSVDYNLAPGADELSYQVFDRDSDWTLQAVRVQAPNVVGTPQNTASLTVLGITRQEQAAMRARLTMAQNVYGRKVISFDIDLEHLDYRAGSVLAVSHDLTQWGFGGRLRAVTVAAGRFIVSVDEPVPATAAATRVLGLRVPGERQMRVYQVSAVSPDGRRITAAGDWPGTGLAGVEDVLWMFDFKATPGQRVRVASITPQGKMTGATVSFVPEDPGFWQYVLYGAWTPPPNNSQLQRAPQITRAYVTEQLKREGSGYATELTVSFEVTGRLARAEVWGATAGTSLKKLGETTSNSFTWGAALDNVWRIEVRPFNDIAGGKAFALSYAVLGLRAPPPDLASLSLNGQVLNWPNISRDLVPDLAGYRIRFNYGESDDWGVATPMHEGLITDSPYQLQVVPPGVITILGKAEDTSGNLSVHAAVLRANLGDAEIANVVLQQDYRALGWPGTYTGAHLAGGDLVADNTSPFYGPAASRFYNPNPNAPFYTANFAAMEWVSERWWAGADIAGSTLTLATDIDGANYSIEYRRPGNTPFYGDPTAPFYGAAADPFYPVDEAWQVWPGSLDVAPSFYQFRVRIGSGPVEGAIRAFVATIDVPDREVSQQQAIGPGPTRLAGLAGLFNVIKTVRGSLEGGTATGFSILDRDAVLGPLIQPYAGASAGGTANFNFDAKGY